MLTLWRKWIAYPIGWLTIMAMGLLVIGWLSNTTGDTGPPMHHFRAVYTAKKVGDEVHLEVSESIRDTLERGRKGISRVLVPHSDGHDLGLGSVTVVDPDGRDYSFTQKQLANGDVELLIDRNDAGTYRYGAKTFTFLISYSLARTVSAAGGSQELVLNVNGTEWSNGFGAVSAELIIDPSLVPHLTGDHACYQGRAGSTKRCGFTRDGDTFRAEIQRVGAYENMTIAVGLEPGTVANPLPAIEARSHGWWGIAALVGIGALALAVALVTRRFVRNPASSELGIVTQFTPPDDLEPVLAADFLGVPERGAAAHLAWLVAEGYGEVTSSVDAAPPSPASALSAADLTRQRQGLRLTWFGPYGRVNSTMDPSMSRITRALFGESDEQHSLNRVRCRANETGAQEVRDATLNRRGMRGQIRFGPLMLGWGYAALLAAGVYQIWVGLAGLGWYFLAAGLVGVMLLLWAFHLLPAHGRLTRRGREVQRHLAGLERFVTTSEGERLRWLNSVETAPRDEASRVDLYEKLLPWAIVFGAENSWRQLLGDMYSRFPERAPSQPAAWAGVSTASSWMDSSRSATRHHSPWQRRASIGDGALATGTKSLFRELGEASRGVGSSSSSTRSSGRGWSGGSSSSGSSRGGGSSGGGRGGGGGGRR